MHHGVKARIVLYRSFSETFSSAKSGSHIAGWSSLVARRAHNPEAVGSNPAPATKCSSRPMGGFFVAWSSLPPFGPITRNTRSEVVTGKAAGVGRLTASRTLRELADEGKLERDGEQPKRPAAVLQGER